MKDDAVCKIKTGSDYWKYEEERSIKNYFREIDDHPLLNEIEEKNLACIIKYCKKQSFSITNDISHAASILNSAYTLDLYSNNLQCLIKRLYILTIKYELYCKKSRYYRNRFLKSNLKLVISMTKKHLNRGLSFLDLVQEGNIGLVRAIEKYDHTMGFRFSTYATWWINHFMVRAISSKSRGIKVPGYLLDKRYSVFKSIELFEQTNHRKPNMDELKNITGMHETGLIEVIRSGDPEVSYDQYTGLDNNFTILGIMHDENIVYQDELVERESLKRIINESLNKLTEKEKFVINSRFGLNDNEKSTLAEIGSLFGLTRERIRQIEKTALDKLAKSSLSELE